MSFLLDLLPWVGGLLLLGLCFVAIDKKGWERWAAGAILIMVFGSFLLGPLLFRRSSFDVAEAKRAIERDFGGSAPSSVCVMSYSKSSTNQEEHVVHFMVASNDCEVLRQNIETRIYNGSTTNEDGAIDAAINRAEQRCLHALKTVRINRNDLDRMVMRDFPRGAVIVVWMAHSRTWVLISRVRVANPETRLHIDK